MFQIVLFASNPVSWAVASLYGDYCFWAFIFNTLQLASPSVSQHFHTALFFLSFPSPNHTAFIVFVPISQRSTPPPPPAAYSANCSAKDHSLRRYLFHPCSSCRGPVIVTTHPPHVPSSIDSRLVSRLGSLVSCLHSRLVSWPFCSDSCRPAPPLPPPAAATPCTVSE